MTSPRETLELLASRGYRFEARGETLRVRPVPDAATLAALRAVKAEIIGIIAAHGGRWPGPAGPRHPYVVAPSVDRSAQQFGACIACGVPWEAHGRPRPEVWEVVHDVARVPLVQAQAVVAAAVAEEVAVSAEGGLCARCRRIGRLRVPDRVCTACAAADGTHE